MKTPGSTRALLLGALLALAACDEAGPRAGHASAARGAAPRAYRCATSIAPEQGAADAALREAYTSWRRRFVTARGAGRHLRVARGAGDRHDTVSEGIGYGMLLAVYMDDRPTFDGLWAYAQRYRNPRGLMSWRVAADGAPPGGAGAAAVDADEDMAFALVVADSRWGGYRAHAQRLIRALLAHGVEAGSDLPKPGDIWGGSDITNPSYFAPAYYRVFAKHTGDARWTRVADASYALMERVRVRHAAATGLQPDWTSASGDPVRGHPGRSFDYGYDATRVPWRLAKDAAWHCDARAARQLAALNSFFQRVGPANLRDGYTLAGRTLGRSHNAAFVGPAAAGALASRDTAYRHAVWRELVALRDVDYYDGALRLLGLLLASGNMPPPEPRNTPLRHPGR